LMDVMMQAYMEETEEMLQKAEECIIRLEIEYSAADVNELFRIAHTIKGSSHMVGYEDIGNLMHKIEDMLDGARNGTIQFDQRIISLCFEGLDTVKKMLQYKTEPASEELMVSLTNSAQKIREAVENFIRSNKKEEKKLVVSQSETGMVSSLLKKEVRGKNKYFITFFIEEDAPMVSPVLIMILQRVEEIGTLVYSSFTDMYFNQGAVNAETKIFDIMICTNIGEAELYTYFALFYVEKLNIVNMSRAGLIGKDYYFNVDCNDSYKTIVAAFKKLYHVLSDRTGEPDKTEGLQSMVTLHKEANSAFENINNRYMNNFIKDFNGIYSLAIRAYDGQLSADEQTYLDIKINMLTLLERGYNYIKGKNLFYVFKSEKEDFIHKFNNFIEMVNRASILIILIDLSELELLQINEVKDLIDIKKRLKEQDIEMGIIAESPTARRIVNIFDSIKPVEEFKVFRSELEAIVEMIL